MVKVSSAEGQTSVVPVSSEVRNDPIEVNYLYRVRNLVAKILVQLNHIADKDRTQIDKMKAEYRKATQDSANLTKDLGWNGLKFSGIAMAASLVHLSPHQSDREIGGIFAREFCPRLGEMFGSGMQSEMKKADALAQLVLNEYSAKTSKGQSDASNKQEVIGILDKVLESVKRAAQAG